MLSTLDELKKLESEGYQFGGKLRKFILTDPNIGAVFLIYLNKNGEEKTLSFVGEEWNRVKTYLEI